MEFVDKIYIISLETHVLRKQLITADLDSAGFDMDKVEWINAIDGTQLDINQCIKDDKINPTFRDPHGILTTTIYGCAMSHNTVYERFLKTSDDYKTALVLEDDASITHTLLRLLLTQSVGYKMFRDEIKKVDWDVIMLGGQQSVIEHEKGSNSVLKPVRRYPITYAGHSYMINKNGAEKLLENNQKIQYAADVNLYTSNVNLYCTPTNYFEQKTGALSKITISNLYLMFGTSLMDYNDVNWENRSTTTIGDYINDENSSKVMQMKQLGVSKKLDVDFVDWKPFVTSYGDEINDWANIHLKIENE